MRQYPAVIVALFSFAWGVLRGGLIWVFTRDRRRVIDSVSHHMAVRVCRRLRLRVQLRDVERMLDVQPCVVIANHQSQVDHQVLANLYRLVERPIVMAKMVGKWNLPVAKQLFLATGNIVADPSDPRLGRQAFRQAQQALRHGQTVMLYPEGTRSADGRVGPLARGAFLLAVHAQRPIVPVVVSHYRPALDMHAGIMQWQHINVRVLEPVSTEGMTLREVPELRDRVRTLMQQALDADDVERGLMVSPGGPSAPARGSRELVPA